MIITALATLAVSCSKDTQQSGLEMRFSVPEVRSGQVSDLNSDGNSFTVYCVRTDAATHNNPLTVFDNETVTRIGGLWQTENIRMWVKDKDYRFASVYPETETLTGATVAYNGPADKYVSITGYALWDKDLMVSTPIVCEANTYIAERKQVALTFTHILSDLRFNIKLTSELATSPNPTATLKSVKLYGLSTSADYSEGSWTPGEVHTADNTPFNGADIVITASNTVSLFGGDIMTIPQDITAAMKIDFEYTVGSNPDIKRESFKIADLIASTPSFGQSKVYTFTFRINGDIITFDVPQVEEWKEATGGIITVE